MARTLTGDIGAPGFFHQLLVAADDDFAVSRALRGNDDSRTKEKNCWITLVRKTTEQA